jgi:hypothetical protein
MEDEGVRENLMTGPHVATKTGAAVEALIKRKGNPGSGNISCYFSVGFTILKHSCLTLTNH